ncbi:MAG TPA: substrate-binding domain-containing protein [Jatrophihabitans sp.]|uniref:substrate-binding domain-containing protein n=1 Tax=Jatrophihabitans sp. TaxID=1932789 RepID=UPI002F188B91
MKKSPAVAVALLVLAALPGCASEAKQAQSSDAPVKVAVIYSKTGLLSAYGQQYVQGFNAGIEYATKGTSTVAGHKLDIAFVDDTGNPSTAVAAAKQRIGQGYKIIAGTTDSGIANQLAPLAEQNKVLYIDGPAATDKITGSNKFTFRSGRQSYQDVATAGTFVGDPKGKKVLVFAQDTTFGQGNAAAVKQILGGKGAVVSDLLVPASTTDFTPFARQAAQARPDLVFVAWAGATTATMWQALDQQKVLSSTTVVTGLANTASYGAYGPASAKINFLSHYFPDATDNAVNTAMKAAITKAGGTPDLFSPDGFVAAQMIVRAVEKADGDDVAAMIAGLEGWTFEAPKGSQTIRAEDHAMLQPMFRAKLTGSAPSWTPQLVATVAASDTAPVTASG